MAALAVSGVSGASIAYGQPPPGLADGAEMGYVGRFVPPVPVIVVTPFRPPESRYGSGHRGVDLAATAGQSVVAADDGIVVYAGRLADRGVVSIEHVGGLRTTYEPVLASVSAGDRVLRGEQIGVVDRGHKSCLPAVCLHFGARLPDRVYLDPLALLGPWQVRLKPWEFFEP